MGKRKKAATSTTVGKEELFFWNHAMDSFLIDALVHQHEIGNRVGSTFLSKAYDNIVKELSTSFPTMKFDKDRIQNRIKYIKKGFTPCYDIFKNSGDGFSWDPMTSMFCAEPEVWDKFIEAHPEAASWKIKAIYNYDKLVKLYGHDRATREEVENVGEIRKRTKASNQKRDQTNNIEEIDHMVSNDELYLEGNDCGINENSPPSNNQSEGTSSIRKCKTKARKEDDLEALKEIFHSVADIILKSTTELVKAMSVPQTPKSEIWNILVDLGFERVELNAAYIFLIKYPDMLDGFLGCPPTARKELLKQMMWSK